MTADLIHLAGDTPRARRSDPEASHVAADRSSRSRERVRDAVLEILREDGPMTGGEMNEAYMTWRVSNPRTFPRCHFDTPRKRLGEAADEALVDVIDHRHRTVEAVYRLSPEGRAWLESLGR